MMTATYCQIDQEKQQVRLVCDKETKEGKLK